MLAFALVAAVAAPASAQGSFEADTSLHRVFLSDGSVLPSYGPVVAVGDRVIFHLFLREVDARPDLQLMSLPAGSVDREKTDRYSNTLHARVYAATRGESDFAAISTEVFRAIEQLSAVKDTRQRLRLAEEARRRLLGWSAAHHHYRAADVQELASLFEDVIDELRLAAGESRFAFDLVAGQSSAPAEPLVAKLTVRGSLEKALAAADAADHLEERYAILRRVESVARENLALADLARLSRARLDADRRADEAYRTLAESVRVRAARARSGGDVAAASRLRGDLDAADAKLGRRRPRVIAALEAELAAVVEETNLRRLALDHWTYVRGLLAAYERDIRGARRAFDVARPALERIKSARSVPFGELEALALRLARSVEALSAIRPPDAVAAAHATLVSALRMAHEAAVRRVRAVMTKNRQTDREASSAAAAALLLDIRGRADLLAAMNPPTLNQEP